MDSFSVGRQWRPSYHCCGCNPCQRVCVEATLHPCARWCCQWGGLKTQQHTCCQCRVWTSCLLLRGSTHDCACSPSSTSTPCAYSLTLSCFVSPGAWRTDSLLVKLSLGSFFHSHMCEPSVGFPLFSAVRSLVQGRNSMFFVSDFVTT